MPRIAFHGSPGKLPSRLTLARTRNGGRANAKLFAHEHEIVSARTRNYSRTNTKLIPHEHEMRHELRHEFRHEMRHEMPHEIARTKLLCECLKRFLVFGGACRPGQALANESGESISGPFRSAILGGNSGAISCRQFRAGNFVQAIPCGQFRAPAPFPRPPVRVGCRRRARSLAIGAPSRAASGVHLAVPQVSKHVKLFGAPRAFRGPFRVLLCLQGISFCDK